MGQWRQLPADFDRGLLRCGVAFVSSTEKTRALGPVAVAARRRHLEQTWRESNVVAKLRRHVACVHRSLEGSPSGFELYGVNDGQGDGHRMTDPDGAYTSSNSPSSVMLLESSVSLSDTSILTVLPL